MKKNRIIFKFLSVIFSVVFCCTLLFRPAPVSAASTSFSDVHHGDYYCNAVQWASSKGITTGTDHTHFKPNNKVSRGEMVTFLYRYYQYLETCSEKSYHTSSCSDCEHHCHDVHENDYFSDAVSWAYEYGITTGTSSTSFSPYRPIYRGEIVTLMYRAAKNSSFAKGSSYLCNFDDVATSSPFYTGTGWAESTGIATGYNSRKFGPYDCCTRGQAVTFLYRMDQMFQKYLKYSDCHGITVTKDGTYTTLLVSSKCNGNNKYNGLDDAAFSNSSMTIIGDLDRTSSKATHYNYNKFIFKTNSKTIYQSTGGDGDPVRFTRSQFETCFWECYPNGLALVITMKNGTATTISLAS